MYARIVETDAGRVERDDTVQVFERMREREVAQAALRQHRLAGDHRPRRGSADQGRDVRSAGAPDVADHALQHCQVCRAIGLERQRLAAQVHASGDVEGGVVADETHRVDLQRLPVDRQGDWPLIPDPIVDELQIELFNGRADLDRVAVVQVADDADRAAGRRLRVRREIGLEDAHERIERGVADAERQVRVSHVLQRDAAGARHGQPRRGCVELIGQQLVAHRQPTGDLADALVTKKQILNVHLDVVARLLERAAAARRKIKDAGPRREVGKRRESEGLDPELPALGAERVGPVPRDVRRPGDDPRRLGRLRAFEANAVAFEAQACRCGFEALAVGRPIVDVHPAEAEGTRVGTVEMEVA